MKKLLAAGLAVVMALTVFVAPATGMEAEAKPRFDEGKVYTNNLTESFPRISISTPETTTKLYAGLTWDQLDINAGVRLNVTDSACGAAAMNAYQYIATSLGATLVHVVDLDLEAYLNGWCKDIVVANSPIRVAFDIPATWDKTRDYAVISMTYVGTIEVLGDIDANPLSVTVDTRNFDTVAFISAPAGTFNAYRKPSLTALDNLPKPGYVKEFGGSINAAAVSSNVHDIAIVTDKATAIPAIGNSNCRLEITDIQPGPIARTVLETAILKTNSYKYSLHTLDLYNGSTKIEQTNQKLLVALTVPYNFPAYADYAVAVVDEKGSVQIMKDLDLNPNSITILTDDFRTIGIMCGPKGAYDALK